MQSWKKLIVVQMAAVIFASSAFAHRMEVPDWLRKPGFKAIIGSINDTDFVYIESREDGLIFRHCEIGDQPDVIAGTAMPDTCPSFLTTDIAIPPELLMKGTFGLKRVLETSARVGAVGGIFVMGAFSWGYASQGALAAGSFISEDPIQEIKDLHKVQKVFKDMIKYGDKSFSNRDGQVITELVHDSYDNIKQGVTIELLAVVKEMMKKDKSIDLKWKVAYHTLINQRYAQLAKKEPVHQQPQSQPEAPAANPEAAAPENEVPAASTVQPAQVDDRWVDE